MASGEHRSSSASHRGFDEWWGLLETHDSALWSSSPGFDPDVVPLETLWEGTAGSAGVALADYDTEQRRYFDAEVFDRTESFIRRSAADDKPFFAYLPVAFPHFPTLPHPDFEGVDDFADAFVELDTRVGHLLDLLAELSVDDNTVVIVTSDNGAEDVLPWRGWTGPWGGSYFTAMEGSLRVPFIVRWPDRVPAGGVSNEMTMPLTCSPPWPPSAGPMFPVTDRSTG